MGGSAVDAVMAGWNGLQTGIELGGALGAIFHDICFTAGTLVHSATGMRPIETLRVGHRTLTEGTKDGEDLPGDDPTQVEPATWRLVRLQTAKAGGSDNLVDVELLRPLAWIEQTEAIVGSRIHFELPELGIDGPACVLGIEPCPEIEAGRGRVITGTFSTALCAVLELRLSNGEMLEPTRPHRFKSETRQDWVAAEDLRVGEFLRTASRQAVTVQSTTLKAGEHRVYNLEVEQEHQFYVGEGGVLVHNEYATQKKFDFAVEERQTQFAFMEEEEGVVYLRRNAETGGEYVGQAESKARYIERQAEHARDYPDADFDFEILGRAKPGVPLDVLEESWIRAGGGPSSNSNPGGRLENGRWQMNEEAYRAAGGNVPR